MRCCVLGCGCGTDDLDHYVRCRIFWEFVLAPRPKGLGLQGSANISEHFLAVECGMSDEDKVRMALGIYGLYRAVQVLRIRCNPALSRPMVLLRLWTKRAADGTIAGKLLRYDGSAL